MFNFARREKGLGPRSWTGLPTSYFLCLQTIHQLLRNGHFFSGGLGSGDYNYLVIRILDITLSGRKEKTSCRSVLMSVAKRNYLKLQYFISSSPQLLSLFENKNPGKMLNEVFPDSKITKVSLRRSAVKPPRAPVKSLRMWQAGNLPV